MAQMNNELGLFFSLTFKNELKEIAKWTSDVPYLNQFENHYVFVYGSLKRGQKRGDLLTQNSKTKFCGVAVTETPEYDVLLHVNEDTKHNFPVAFSNISKTRNAKIKGELWLVPTETILQMDKIEGNGYLYDRVWTTVHVGTEKVHTFIYEGVKSFWKFQDLVDLPILKENGKPYHFYHGGMADKIASNWIRQREVSTH